MKRIGHKVLIAGLILELIFIAISTFITLSAGLPSHLIGQFIVVLLLQIVILIIYAIASYLSVESKGALMLIMILTFVSIIMAVIDRQIPYSAIVIIVGAGMMLADFNAAMGKRY